MSRLVALLGLSLVVLTAVFSEEMEIVVTASRVEEDARSTPSFVRIIPEDVIERGDSVLDALRTLPDIAIRESSPGKEYVSMGGFGENGFARTLILVDGRPVNRADMASVNWRSIPLDRVERIEVVKGPMSSQYGDQAVAGTINIITKDPEGFEAWARGNLTTNLTNRQAAGAAWGGESFRAEGAFSREDFRPTRDRSDSRTITANLGLGATAGLVDFNLGGSFSDGEYQLPGGLTEAQYDNNPDQAVNQEDEVSEITWSTNLNTKASFGQLSLAMPLSWRRVDSTVDMTSWFSFNDVILDDLRGTIQADMSLFIGDSAALVPVAGIDANWSKISVDAYAEKERINLNSSESARRYDLGAWARLKALLGMNWVADAGMRFSVYEISGGGDSVMYTPFVYDVGASWLPGEKWAVSFRYGRVFRYPMLDEQASYYGFGPPGINMDLKPEFGHHVTSSLEYRAGRFTTAAAPYFIAMNDEIAYNPLTFKNENIGDTYHVGGVVSGAWSGSVLGLEASYSYDAARFADTGKTVPLVPEHTVYGRISVKPVGTLEFSTDARVSSEYFKGGDNDNAQGAVSGRIGWNAGIDWRPMEGLTIYAKALNLLDDRTPTVVYWNSFTGDAWYPTEGREFKFGANWQY
ncbi:MAG: TonB-dependent receptor [Spirochaetaceae bacterium]|nr:TonB-dependent receptor [Spirochaetaceae bacterium]